jgi:hypothetical protein
VGTFVPLSFFGLRFSLRGLSLAMISSSRLGWGWLDPVSPAVKAGVVDEGASDCASDHIGGPSLGARPTRERNPAPATVAPVGAKVTAFFLVTCDEIG